MARMTGGGPYRRSLLGRAGALAPVLLLASVAALPSGGASAADIPGDATTRATLKLGLRYTTGLIDRANDADWYRVRLVKGRHYAFEIESGRPGPVTCNEFLDLALADGNGRVLRGARDVCSEDAGFELTIARSGVYFVRVSGSHRLGYILRGAVDAADNASTKAILAVNKPADGTLLFGFDTDYFRIHLIAGKTYYIFVTEFQGGCLTTAGVKDKSDNLLAGFFFDLEVGQFSVPATDDYFVVVTDGDGDHGCPYRVSVTDNPPP
jgi:hypothetical protein